MFGAKSSQDVFDEARFRIIGDITHCLNQRDDILLEGRDETKHIEVPKTVLVTVSKRAQNHIQPRKMPVWKGTNQILYQYVFSEDGPKP